MLSVDFDRLGVVPGALVLDIGCGAGRHSIEAARRGAVAVAVDLAVGEVRAVRGAAAAAEAMLEARLLGGAPAPVCADATRLPFADSSFDVVIASEVLEHLPDDRVALTEIGRVLRPGGRLAVTVPRRVPEAVCWWLSRAYHEVEGGHLRIYSAGGLRRAMLGAGLRVTGRGHAHALHTPYWWLRCLLGVHDEPGRLPVRLYHRILVWDLMERPLLTRVAERLLDPVLGKSLVLYAAPMAPAHVPGPTTVGASAVRGDDAAAA